MLINLRNALMTGKKSPLPPGARWVEYLESTGDQWIDTGEYGSQSLKTEIVMQATGDAPGKGYFGAFTNSLYYYLYCSNTPTRFFQVAMGTTYSNSAYWGLSKRKFVYDGGIVTMDGTRIYSAVATPAATAYTLTLFKMRNATGAFYNGAPMRVYSCKMRSNGVPVHDFQPIAIGTTGYMLDLVSGEYLPYGNKGTGDFVIGPDKNA